MRQTERTAPPAATETSRNGRVRPGYSLPTPKAPPGPKAHFVRKQADPEQESED
jgi:hypothetical protein